MRQDREANINVAVQLQLKSGKPYIDKTFPREVALSCEKQDKPLFESF